MSLVVTIYAAILFFILTPAILVRLPPSGSKWTVAAVHAIVFAIVFHFTHKFVLKLNFLREGYTSKNIINTKTVDQLQAERLERIAKRNKTKK